MTFKFTTHLKYFEFRETYIDDAILMEWYCYTPQSLNGFTFKQVPQLEAYMKSTASFGGVVNYQQAYEEEIPLINPNGFIENPALGFPEFLIISPKKELQQETGITPYTEILLCNEDGVIEHDYPLEFSIIGKVLGLAG